MAKRNMGKYVRGIVNVEKDCGSLATKSLVIQANPDVTTEEMRVSSVVARWSFSHNTPIADAGPLLVGFAHSDYSGTEIEEYLENVDSWDVSDTVQSREISKRLIRQVGTFQSPTSITDAVHLNNGKPIKTRLNWPLATGQTVQIFVYNLGGAQISATGNSRVEARGHANLWRK